MFKKYVYAELKVDQSRYYESRIFLKRTNKPLAKKITPKHCLSLYKIEKLVKSIVTDP